MRIAGFLVLLSWAVSAAGQEDAQRGKVMYETHCGGCHYERLHDRAHTKIGALPDLRDEVSRWAPQTGRRFSLDEREDVVQFLNQSHYRFGLAPTADQPSSRTSP